MKVSEMNTRQIIGLHDVYWAARDYIGGLENAILDESDLSEDYKAVLNDHDNLVETIYRMVTRDIKDIRFCGKDWIMEHVKKQVENFGY